MTLRRYDRLRGCELETTQDEFVRLVSGLGAVDVHVVHSELNSRSSLTIGLSILGKEVPTCIGIQKDEFSTGLVAKLLAEGIGDAEFSERSVEESFEVALCAVRRYAVDEDLHGGGCAGVCRRRAPR